MTVVDEIVKKKKGYTLHFVKTDQYKTNTIVWKMKAPLENETVTLRALLPNVLQNSSKKYPTTTSLQSYLEELYGANFFVDVGKKGEYHIMSFSIELANEKFLKEKTPLLRTGLDFLASILFAPNAENGRFHESSVTSEKRILKQRLQSLFDDKMRYASQRLIEEMCENEPYALHPYGRLDDVDSISSESLYQYYERALREDELDLYVVGDVDFEEVEGACDQLFLLSDRQPKLVEKRSIPSRSEVKVVKEQQYVKQGKLNIGYRTHVSFGDPDYFALQVFNGIFGGFSHSKLFLNVREKESLAYYASSHLESHKGLMMVMSGIESKNYEKAVAIIREQLEAMKNGDFSEKEIEQTKAVIHNQLLETIDTQRGLIEMLYHNVLAKKNVTVEDWLQGIVEASDSEIVKVAEKIEMDTIYFLSGQEGLN
ncbi:EF-P 5-aminopentanol modification-associated protein YfmF [Bacillus smithii]|uniref:EF-P 5-aminopentanol modification-associated protein YfmF n=1 Tax=Bacillus smithii TaxID=1479 RepID=UPI002E1C5EC0|nr:pitrilysin family protein [Bacillus smithii]MED1457824.1 pitrilysin family protein [Bacillus smithii]